MTATALIMAGGRGERMAAALPGARKPIVAVRGVPMIERNLCWLLGHGVRHLFVSVRDVDAAVAEHLERRGRAVVEALGGTLEPVVEEQPLGTIGCAARLAERTDELLVANADNLTCLDAAALVAAHRHHEASMTVATHWQEWRSALGEVDVAGDRLIAYREKPQMRTRISSGTYVLGRSALRALTGTRTDVPELVQRLLAVDAPVHAWQHNAPWIDVNDAEAVARAERLVAEYRAFECWAPAAGVEVAGVLLHGSRGLLLESRPADARLYPHLWDTPGGKLEPGEEAETAARREIREELGLALGAVEPVAVFDDVDVASGTVVRHHVFAAEIGTTDVPGATWWSLDEAPALPRISPVVVRSLAAWRRSG